MSLQVAVSVVLLLPIPDIGSVFGASRSGGDWAIWAGSWQRSQGPARIFAPIWYGCAWAAVPANGYYLERTRAAIFINFVVALAASLVIQNGVLASTLQQTPFFSWSLASSCRRWKLSLWVLSAARAS